MYDNLRAEMSRNNVTGLKLASVLHITHQSFYKKINGKSDFTIKEIKGIQNYFRDVDPSRKDVYTLDYLFRSKGVS